MDPDVAFGRRFRPAGGDLAGLTVFKGCADTKFGGNPDLRRHGRSLFSIAKRGETPRPLFFIKIMRLASKSLA